MPKVFEFKLEFIWSRMDSLIVYASATFSFFHELAFGRIYSIVIKTLYKNRVINQHDLGWYRYTETWPILGQNLGLFKGNLSKVATGDKQIVAVEFDTFFNVGIDTSGSHMGIDVKSIISQAYTNVTVPGKNLTSGLPMTCNITYGNETQTLAAILKIGDATYRVNTNVDLRFMPSVVTIGFSGATGAADELYQIMSWKFRSTFNPHARKSSESPPPAPKILLVEVITGPIIGVIAIVCIFVGIRRWQLCTRKKRYRSLAGGIGHIGYRKLAHAANKFAEENKLGQGGSASVYRGELTNPSRAVAIKRFNPATSSEGRKAFEDELRIATRLRHRNLVELIGWCYYGQRYLVEFICWWRDDRYTRLFLVYELLPQGSLDQHLHEGKRWLPWSKRYDIILDLGSALQYLHVDCEQHKQCVVHGDIKSSNMLLDPSYSAKLGDFGLARSVHQETGAQTTDVVQSTYGYIDPVFVNTSQRNRQSDIYNFGIVLLEMVSGRDPTARLNDRPPLTSWVRSLYHGNALLEAADVRLIGGESIVGRQQMKRALLVGLLCVHQDLSSRPSIMDTMDALRSERLESDITPLAPVIPLLMP
ncbi:L-type lectin-domain containing receptor kinase IX.1-like [Aegilops tauschii subsp. strangulata]